MNTFVKLDLSSKIKFTNNSQVKKPSVSDKTIFLELTNFNEVLIIIEKLQVKNGGVDNISTKVIEHIAIFIADVLRHIVNLSIEKGIWLNALKVAEVIPVHKSGSKSCPSNYRPISLVSNIAKMFAYYDLQFCYGIKINI